MFDIPLVGILSDLFGSEDDDEDDSFELHLPEGREIETLRITREESRTALDHQLQKLTDIDDKAMRTVRITLVTLGILASATALEVGPDYVNHFTVGGIIALVMSILFGLLTYSASVPKMGIGRGYYEDILQEDYTEEEWLEVLIAGYDEWQTETAATVEDSVRLLNWTELFLAIGVVFLGLGVILPYYDLI